MRGMFKVEKYVPTTAYRCAKCGVDFPSEEACLEHVSQCEDKPPTAPLYKKGDWVLYHGSRAGKIVGCEQRDYTILGEANYIYDVLPIFFEETGIVEAGPEDKDFISERDIRALLNKAQLKRAACALNKMVSDSPTILKEANIEGFISDRSLDGPGLFIGLEIAIPLDNMKKEKKASE